MFFSYPRGDKKVEINSSIPVRATTDTSVQLPLDVVPVMTCCCSNKGTMELEANINKTVVSPFDTVGIQFRCNNNSSVNVTNIYVQMEQIIEWRCNGHSKKIRNMLDKKIHNPKLYPELMTRLPKSTFSYRNKRHNRPLYQYDQLTPFATTTQGEQQWHEAELQVPNHSLDSYQGHAVNVRHVVSVILKTKVRYSFSSQNIFISGHLLYSPPNSSDFFVSSSSSCNFARMLVGQFKNLQFCSKF